MRKIFVVLFGLMAVAGFAAISWGEEKAAMPAQQNAVAVPAPEAAASVPAAAMPAETMPAVGDAQNVISSYIKEQSDEMGDFDIYDPQTQETRELTLVKILDKVGKTSDNYFACAEFSDKNSSEKLDLDFDIENTGGKLNVVDVKIHKVNDAPRFTYDEKGNRMAVETPAEEASEAASSNSEAAPAANEPAAASK